MLLRQQAAGNLSRVPAACFCWQNRKKDTKRGQIVEHAEVLDYYENSFVHHFNEGETNMKWYRKHMAGVVAAVLASFLLIGGCFVPTPPVMEESGIVLIAEAKGSKTTSYEATADLNVRSKASSKGKVCGGISKGDTVKVYSISDGWAKISFDGGTAYVSAKYLAKAGNTKAASVSKATKSSAQSETKVWLSETGTKYHRINNCGKMNPNKAVQVTQSEAESRGYEPCKKCW